MFTFTYVLSVSMSSVMTFLSFSVSVSCLLGVTCCEGALPSLSTGELFLTGLFCCCRRIASTSSAGWFPMIMSPLVAG